MGVLKAGAPRIHVVSTWGLKNVNVTYLGLVGAPGKARAPLFAVCVRAAEFWKLPTRPSNWYSSKVSSVAQRCPNLEKLHFLWDAVHLQSTRLKQVLKAQCSSHSL